MFAGDNYESIGATLGHVQTGTFGVIGTRSQLLAPTVIIDDEYPNQPELCMRAAQGWTRALDPDNLIRPTPNDALDDLFRLVLAGHTYGR